MRGMNSDHNVKLLDVRSQLIIGEKKNEHAAKRHTIKMEDKGTGVEIRDLINVNWRSGTRERGCHVR